MPSFELHVESFDERSATIKASELRRVLSDHCADANVVSLPNPGHQDTGTVLQVVLAAPAVVTLAAGIAAWLKRQPRATLRFKKTGDVELTNISSSDAVEIVRLLQQDP